jgi:hypothetical protein
MSHLEKPKAKGWTEENVKIVKTIGEKRAAYVWLYNETANYYEGWNTFFVVVLAISGYLLGTTGIPSLFATENCSTVLKLRWLNLTIQILVICMGVFGTIHKLLDFVKEIGKARWASGKNAALFTDIRKELRKPPEERQEHNKFYDKIIDAESKLQGEAPFIPEKIVKRYYAKMGNHALKYELLFSNQVEIEIYQQPTGTASEDHISQAKKAEKVARRERREILKQNEEVQNIDVVPVENPAANRVSEYKKLTTKQRYELEKYFFD